MSSRTTTENANSPVSLENLAYVLGNSIRWQILAELATGEPLRIQQIAKAIGEKPDATSKHLQAMRSAEVVVFGENRIYQLREQFKPAPDKWEIDFGHCIVRLPEPLTVKRKRR
jgi:predicted transcriptional regulator